ncbi:HAD hydrolase-like protein [Candidatus Woesearchaeota archaeon]|nr:HAD hydrolase-like protein [Candidatus Woesearchaeota archaeon]
MADFNHTFKQALNGGVRRFFTPQNYRVTHHLEDVRSLEPLVAEYDLIILDRDCTLQPYHGRQRVADFEPILEKIAEKAAIVSNSDFEEFKRIGQLYGHLFPIHKLIGISEEPESTFLLNYQNGEISLWYYNPPQHMLHDATPEFLEGNQFKEGVTITHHYKKPDPLPLRAVRDLRIHRKKISPINPKILMVGDSYWTDIMAGNLAGFDTARVVPYMPASQPFVLRFLKTPLDSVAGYVMHRRE